MSICEQDRGTTYTWQAFRPCLAILKKRSHPCGLLDDTSFRLTGPRGNFFLIVSQRPHLSQLGQQLVSYNERMISTLYSEPLIIAYLETWR